MLDSTIKTIYALKQNYREMAINGGDKIVLQLWSEITGTSAEGFNDVTMTNLAKGLFMDYIETADDPCGEVQTLFNQLPTSSSAEFREAVWSSLALVSVRNKHGDFVNGFRESDE